MIKLAQQSPKIFHSAVPAEGDVRDSTISRIHFIKKSGYYLRSQQIDYQLDYIERSQTFLTPKTVTDCLSGFWMLYIFDASADQLWVESCGQKKAVTGSTALFVPHQHPVALHYNAGMIHWQAFSCFTPLEPSFPTTPTLFPWDPLTTIRNYTDLADILRRAANQPHTDLSIPDSHTPYAAHKTKFYLEKHFSEDTPMGAIFKDIKLSHSTATHSFTDHYGIAPIAYRNLLRSFDALRRISLGEQVMEAAMNVGYKDYSRFYRNFRASLGCSPADFSRRGFTNTQPDDPIKQLRKIDRV